MTSREDLLTVMRQAINDSEGAAGSPDHLLDVQAAAAVEAVERLGYVLAHGVEFAVKAGDVVLASGFNTEAYAREVAPPGAYVTRRWVGVWEPVE